MTIFDVNWLRWYYIMILAGVAIVITLILGFYLTNLPGRPPGKSERTEGYPGVLEETPRGIPALLVVFYVAMSFYLVGHALLIWLTGASF